jgi:hypothetical protein
MKSGLGEAPIYYNKINKKLKTTCHCEEEQLVPKFGNLAICSKSCAQLPQICNLRAKRSGFSIPYQ